MSDFGLWYIDVMALRGDKDILADSISGVDFERMPLTIARALGSTSLSFAQKRRAIDIIRWWGEYVESDGVRPDPIAIRYHTPRFAAETFGQERNKVELLEADIQSLQIEGKTYEETIADEGIDTSILHNPHVAVIGGVARLGLKMHGDVDVKSELPLSDVDAIVSSQADDVGVLTRGYGIDITGAKVVDGDVMSRIPEILANVDCSMNQVAVYDGRLYYTLRAFDDSKTGAIRITPKNDPLFGSEGSWLPGGQVYLDRRGFYRTLSFLLRGKGNEIIVSQENLDREVPRIGRYWLVMLLVKLMPMSDELKKYDAVGHWHEVAQRLGATGTSSPNEFLDELLEEYPETGGYGSHDYDDTAQARWVIGKLISRGLEDVREDSSLEAVGLPDIYTPANLKLADSFPPYDLDAFVAKVNSRDQ